MTDRKQDEIAVVPTVTTLAQPTGSVLVAARFAIQKSAEAQKVFEEFKGLVTDDASASALADTLTQTLVKNVEGTVDQVYQAALYLVDEYRQFGDTILVVDPKTGRAITKISPDDIWQPAPVPRSDGRMAKPQARLRPELEGMIIEWVFNREKEVESLTKLSTRVHTTLALAEAGDPRLRVATREGRTNMAEELRRELSLLLPETLTGAPSTFFRFLRVRNEMPANAPEVHQGLVAFARVSTTIVDMVSRNLKFDTLSSTRSSLATQLATEVARTVSQLTHSRGANEVSFSTYIPDEPFYVMPPDVALAVFKGVPCFPVEGAMPLALLNPDFAGYLVPTSFDLKSREINGRWDVVAQMTYDLAIDLEYVQALTITDLPTPEVKAVLV